MSELARTPQAHLKQLRTGSLDGGPVGSLFSLSKGYVCNLTGIRGWKTRLRDIRLTHLRVNGHMEHVSKPQNAVPSKPEEYFTLPDVALQNVSAAPSYEVTVVREMFSPRPGKLVLLTDPVQVLAWEGEEIWGTVKLEPDLDHALQAGAAC